MFENSEVDNSPVKFTQTDSACHLCEQHLSNVQDRPTHWRACSNQRRRRARTSPSIYMHERLMADNEFGKLKVRYPAKDVENSAYGCFWMMQAMEALGEKDYRSMLESVGPGVAGTDLDREVLEVLICRFTVSGNNLLVLLSMEDAVGNIGSTGLLWPDNPTTDIKLIPNWKNCEIVWLKEHLDDMRSFEEIYQEFVRLPRLQQDGLPGRTRFAVAVWMFKLRTVAEGALQGCSEEDA